MMHAYDVVQVERWISAGSSPGSCPPALLPAGADVEMTYAVVNAADGIVTA
jgi:hypothetical protein